MPATPSRPHRPPPSPNTINSSYAVNARCSIGPAASPWSSPAG